MYVLDTNVFYTLGHYFPSRFPTIWRLLNAQAENEKICSVREVLRELEYNCPFDHVNRWIKDNKKIFKKPNEEELKVVKEIFEKEEFMGLVKRKNLLKGLPVADPFIIAAGKVKNKYVVTQEILRPHGATIPNVCQILKVNCISVEKYFEIENIKY